MANIAKFNSRVVMKHDIEANWITAGNNGFIPLEGEIIVYTNLKKMKIGDGQTGVNNLPFFTYSIDEIDEFLSNKSQVQLIAWAEQD